MKLILVNIENTNNDAVNVLDLRSDTAAFKPLYDLSSFFIKEISLNTACNLGQNLLIIDRIDVLPQFRSQLLMRAMLKYANRLFSIKSSVTAVNPLSFLRKPAWDTLEEKASNNVIKTFYENAYQRIDIEDIESLLDSFNFRRLPETGLLYSPTRSFL